MGVTAASAALRIWWERRSPNPLVPLAMFTHRSIGPLFMLSLMTGFCMFAVMYYTPLLFQGGFGLSPGEAGLLITPFAVSITVGSILNGRIITRLPHANVMLYAGLSMFCLMAMLLSRTTAQTPRAQVMLTMMLGGAGIGMLLPNLTLFTQRCAPRTQLGVATAMLQSMRMVGGMLGTALVGAFVTHRYTAGIDARVAGHDASAWRSALHDPQILVDPDMAGRFTEAAARAGRDAAAFLDQARASFIDSVHHSQWLVALLVVAGLAMVRRVPPMYLGAPRAVPEAGSEGREPTP